MSTIDISIVVVYLIATLLIGLWQSKSIKSMKDYTIAERNYSTFVIVATVAASWFGGGTSIGKVEKIFNHGTVYLLTTVGLVVQLLLMSEFLVKKFEPYMGLLTIGDIMEKMYGKKAKIITGLFGTIISVSFLGSQIAALGYFMTTIFDISMLTAVIVSYGTVIIYSSFGGIRSVAITDVFQFIIIVVMIPTVVYLTFRNYGLTSSFVELIPRTKLNFTDISHDNYKYFYMMLVFTVPTLIPMSIQRILMSRDVQQSRQSFRWSIIILLIVSGSMTSIALLATITMPEVNANQVIPVMIRDLMPIGIKGLVVAGFLAIIMSSADSFLHSSGVCITHDLLKPILKKSLPVKKELLLTKVLTFTIGGLSIVTAIHTDSLVETIHRGFGFWMPAVLVPLIAGLLKLKKDKTAYYMSVIAGTSSVFLCMYLDVVNAGVTLIALLSSLVAYCIFGRRTAK
ncbi:MAG: sodium:solute symporter family protein [Rickettsiales bacterium]